MIHIDPFGSKIIVARDEHFKAIQCRIMRKLSQPRCLDTTCSICNAQKLSYTSKDTLFNEVRRFLLAGDNLKDLIIADPITLLQIDEKFYKAVLPPNHLSKLPDYFKTKSTTEKKKLKFDVIRNLILDIQKIFNYDWLVGYSKKDQYSAYHLAENLNRRSCTYCNRTYTTTMSLNGEKLMRPQFDHWYPKSKFPLLALSFFNLIPSCYTCNSSSKGDTVLNTADHIHPYIDVNQTKNFRFKYSYDRTINEYDISIQSTNGIDKSMNTLKELKVDTMYNAHHYELADLIKTKKAYSDKYIEKVAALFPDSGLSKNEVFRMLFGTELDEKDFHKRPMSKFKHDILKELGVIE